MVEKKEKKAVKRGNAHNNIGERIKEIRELIAFSQQDYCDYLKEADSVEVNFNTINGIENGRLITQDDLRNSIYNQVYNIRLAKKDKVLDLAREYADFFIEHKIEIDLEELMSCYYRNEIAYIIVDSLDRTHHYLPKELNDKFRILPFEITVDIDFSDDGQFPKCYMNDTALFVYNFCFFYILKTVPYYSVIERDVYLSEEFNEVANYFLNDIDWINLDPRSKGRYMINLNKQLSVQEHLNSISCIQKYLSKSKEFIETIKIQDDGNGLDKLKENLNIIEKEEIDKEEFKQLASYLKVFKTHYLELIKYAFFYYQHIIIFPDECVVSDLKEKYEFIKSNVTTIKWDKINDIIDDKLKTLNKYLHNKEENFLKFQEIADSLYKLHRKIICMDFHFELNVKDNNI